MVVEVTVELDNTEKMDLQCILGYMCILDDALLFCIECSDHIVQYTDQRSVDLYMQDFVNNPD